MFSSLALKSASASTATRAAARTLLSRRSLAALATNDVWSATGEPLFPATAYTTTPPPATFRDALLLDQSEHAIVVTTAAAPHRIVHVNAAWERLCGYTKQEALHQTLADLIQGRDTNVDLADRTVAAVASHAATVKDMFVINYKKNGSPFKNHVTLAPCRLDLNDNDSHVDLLVGVLEEVDTVPLRMV